MFTGKDEIIIFSVDTQKDKIKQPGDPAHRQIGEKWTAHLRRRHFQINFLTAVAALAALAGQLPARLEQFPGQVYQPIIQQDEKHDQAFHKINTNAAKAESIANPKVYIMPKRGISKIVASSAANAPPSKSAP